MTMTARQNGKMRKAAEHASQACGLPASMCADLLREGWTLTVTTGRPRRWESPLAKVTNLIRLLGEVPLWCPRCSVFDCTRH